VGRRNKEQLAAHRASQRRYVRSGRHAVAQARYAAKNPEQVAKRQALVNRSPRKRAHDLARKYGMTLRQIESIGVDLFPDIKEALGGDRQ
jgi:hypothetical protein